MHMFVHVEYNKTLLDAAKSAARACISIDSGSDTAGQNS